MHLHPPYPPPKSITGSACSQQCSSYLSFLNYLQPSICSFFTGHHTSAACLMLVLARSSHNNLPFLLQSANPSYSSILPFLHSSAFSVTFSNCTLPPNTYQTTQLNLLHLFSINLQTTSSTGCSNHHHLTLLWIKCKPPFSSLPFPYLTIFPVSVSFPPLLNYSILY